MTLSFKTVLQAAQLCTATEWSDKWQLPFNDTKHTALKVSHANNHSHYLMRDRTLCSSTIERDLGMPFDGGLKFRQHVAAAVSKGYQILAVIHRSFRKINKTSLSLLYKTLVRSHLEYGNLTWGLFNRTDQKLLERVQRRTTRMVREIDG